MREEALYFIALIPPSPILEKVWEFKREAAEKFGSKASLNSPAHITLHMPFRYGLHREGDLTECLRLFSSGQKPIEVTTTGWGTFPPKVIYVEVRKTEALARIQKELHQAMKKELGLFNANYKDLVFHPHITIAFRDLKKAHFQDAREHFSGMPVEWVWEVNSLALLKHDTKRWNIFKECTFQTPTHP